jgi:thiol:disulfide interchange protein
LSALWQLWPRENPKFVDLFGGMKRLFALAALLILFSSSFAQILDPISWKFDAKRITADEFDLVFTASLDPHWHLYSQNLGSDMGPIPTAFDFMELNGAELIGKVKEPKAKVEYDPNFDMDLAYFEGIVQFTQRVRIPKDLQIKGELTYMVCDSSKCLPPDYVPFSFDLSVAASGEKEKSQEVLEEASGTDPPAGDAPQIFDPVEWSFSVEDVENGAYKLIMRATIDPGWHLYSLKIEEDGPIPTTFTFEDSEDYELVGEMSFEGNELTEYDPNFMMTLPWFENEVSFIQQVRARSPNATVKGQLEFMACTDERCIAPEIVEFAMELGDLMSLSDGDQGAALTEADEGKKLRNRGYLGIFIAGFVGGLLALLTPCVFPMIPLTVSFFTKQSKSKAQGMSNALLYGLFIIGIYVILGYLVTVFFGADALNALSTNFWFNLAFFILFVVFAISFFGAFEITLPSSWVNRADQASDKGGIIGIFFMAFTLSLVSFSCTGPIIGTLLVEAAVNGEAAGPLMGMFGFSLALAMPFGLFAAFPGWLNSLPRSGGWLNSVKVVLGFLELALALKFLSNADMVVQAHLLTRELFIAIWIGIFAMLTAYLLGAFKLPHDSPVDRLSVGRMLFGTVTLIFTLYLIPGLWGAPLKLISGFPPPMFYSESPQGVGKSAGVMPSGSSDAAPSASGGAHCPHGLNCFHDYDEAMAYAKEVNKPLMLDFTGWACVNCRKMEEQVWSDPRVLQRLSNDVVLVSLYVDEKLELPAEEQKEVQIGEKTKLLKTVGNKWSYLQASKFGTNSQPYYVILDHDGNPVHESAAYDPDIEKFIEWLDRGNKLFEQNS